MLVHLGIKVPPEIKQQVEQEAAKADRTVSKWVYLQLKAVLPPQQPPFSAPAQEVPSRTSRRRRKAA